LRLEPHLVKREKQMQRYCFPLDFWRLPNIDRAALHELIG
jgi:hypothetical protein